MIVLCTWPFPVGETIWFIQALLYARVILWFMNKYGLMKHYKKILIVTALLTVFFGEFAGIIRFNFHGYTYIPGNAITRALPYMLLGRFLYEKREALFSRPSWKYCLAFFCRYPCSNRGESDSHLLSGQEYVPFRTPFEIPYRVVQFVPTARRKASKPLRPVSSSL